MAQVVSLKVFREPPSLPEGRGHEPDRHRRRHPRPDGPGLGLTMGSLCTILRASEPFQRLNLIFLQLGEGKSRTFEHGGNVY